MGMLNNGPTNEFIIEELNQKINEKNLKNWENYTLDRGNDLSIIHAAILDLMSQISLDDFPPGRKKEVLSRKMIMEQVESDPLVSKLRNELELSIYRIKNKDMPEKKREEGIRALYEKVVRLFEFRNQKAGKMGFESYPHLVFTCQEIDLIESERSIRSYLKIHLKPVKAMLLQYDFTWERWFERLNGMGYEIENDMDSDDVLDFITEHPEFYTLRKVLRVDVLKKGVSGVVFAIDGARDIRMVLKENHTLHGLSTLLHEMGHAMTYYSLPDDPVFSGITSFSDEILATVFERLLRRLLVPEPARSMIDDIRRIESVRCAISFLFEMDLWETTADADKRFLSYQNLLGIHPMPAHLWVLDTFKSVDPCYIHSYVMGEIFSREIEKRIMDHATISRQDILPFVMKHLVTGGMRTPFMDRYQRLLDSLSVF